MPSHRWKGVAKSNDVALWYQVSCHLCLFLPLHPRPSRSSLWTRAATGLQRSPSFGTTVAELPALYMRCPYFCKCGVEDLGGGARRTLTRTACTESVGLHACYHNSLLYAFTQLIIHSVIHAGTHTCLCHIITCSRADDPFRDFGDTLCVASNMSIACKRTDSSYMSLIVVIVPPPLYMANTPT